MVTPVTIRYDPRTHGQTWDAILTTLSDPRWLSLLSGHHLIRFRGFPVHGRFSGFAHALCPELSPYTGHTDRDPVDKNTYTATTIPGLWPIPLHSEMSYLPNYPRRLLFYCIRNQGLGGDSVFANNVEIWQRLPSALRTSLKTHGVHYIRRFPPRHSRYRKALGWTGAFQSWQDHLGVHTQEQAEEVLQGRPHTWMNGWLDLSQTLPAIRCDPEEAWFNQLPIVHINRHIHGQAAVWVHQRARERLGFSVLDATLGDGTPLTEQELQAILKAQQQSATRVPIQAEDVLYFNNLILSHGRQRYLGRRTLHAAFDGLQ